MPKKKSVGKKKSVKRKVGSSRATVKSSKVNYFAKYLTLDWKEIYLLVILWFLFIVLHHVYEAVFGFSENVLIIFYKWVIPIFFLIALIYTISHKRKK